MILEHVWDYSFDPQTNVVDVVMSRLRAKIDADHERIETIRSVGYVFRPACLNGFASLSRSGWLFNTHWSSRSSATILFGVLYWVLARALEERDQAVVERRAAAACARLR